MGFPSTADDYVERALDFPALLVGSSVSSHLVRLPGEAMEPVGIHEGDLLIVDTACAPKPGDAVVADADGERRLLRYAVGRRGPYLVEHHSGAWRVVRDEHAAVWGVVVYSIGSLVPEDDFGTAIAPGAPVQKRLVGVRGGHFP